MVLASSLSLPTDISDERMTNSKVFSTLTSSNKSEICSRDLHPGKESRAYAVASDLHVGTVVTIIG